MKLWRDHLHDIYTSDADHMEKWLAHRVQRPGEKLNHAMVMGGDPGIGKDTILEPIVHAVGQWNWKEVSPQKLFGRFNEFVKSVVLRVNEAHDLGEFDRYSFYDRTKVYAAAPPDILEVDAKNLREHYVPNVTAMIITSNHKEDGLYLPADDRRHYVAWSDATMDQFDEEYWNRIWDWYASGGIEHVAYYLANLDLSDFDPKAPPPKTDAFWAIADASRAPEDAEMADAIDELGETKRDGTIERPKVTMVEQVRQQATGTFKEWLGDRKNARQVPHRFSACGYERVRNPYAADGFWKIGGQRQNIYARKELSQQERLKAAEELRKTERARRQDEEDCEKRHWRR